MSPSVPLSLGSRLPLYRTVLGASLCPTDRSEGAYWLGAGELTIELYFDWHSGALSFKRLEVGGDDLLSFDDQALRRYVAIASTGQMETAGLSEGVQGRDEQERAVRLLCSSLLHVSHRTFSLIGADRLPHSEELTSKERDVPALLAQGKRKEALFRAGNHPDPMVRRRFRQLQDLLAGAPLQRKPFEMIHDPETGHIELVEQTADSMAAPAEVPLHLAGLGIAQIYSILAQALLRGTHSVGIEEPEAHLHAPTTGIDLRHLLDRLVQEGYLEQLFIATHSNLFDLDPEGYFDVSLDAQGATQVERKPLSEIDRRHLYEPGPAKHALVDFLHYMDADAVVFRRPDGSPVSVGEMLAMLQRDDPLAIDFLRDVHGAAVRAVRVKSKKPENTPTSKP